MYRARYAAPQVGDHHTAQPYTAGHDGEIRGGNHACR